MPSHTNRELELMLAGTKPFAAFLLDGELTEEQALSGQPFQQHVDSGRIIRCVAPTNRHGSLMHDLLFALPGEEWRFESYRMLMDSLRGGWSEQQERREGTLLGYTEAENDTHIERLRAKGTPWLSHQT